MRDDTIKRAATEARRFLEHVAMVQLERKREPTAYVTGSKASGALRRASLDLTRALADMRRP